MVSCSNPKCGKTIGVNSWFCDYCGSLRPDCPECGERVSDGECSNCSAAAEVPCEECGSTISADLRECPECGHDPGEKHEEAAKGYKFSNIKIVGGGLAVILIFGYVLIQIMGSIMGDGILSTFFTGFMWLLVAISAGAFLLLGGSLSLFSDSVGDFKQSQADRQMAGDLKLAEEQHTSAEYKKEQREREERKRTVVEMNCPICSNEWKVRDGIGSGYIGIGLRVIGSESLGRVEVQCEDCDHTRSVDVE